MDEHTSPQPQKPQRDYSAIIRPLFITAVIAATAGIIIYLKDATSGPLSPQQHVEGNQLIAHPDTTTAEDARADLNASVKAPVSAPPADDVQPSDSIDHRSPYNAGYEDGYNTGYLDGATGDWEASYDETPRPSDRDGADTTYRGAYQLGYAAGFEDGKNGKTFSIIGGSDEPDDEEETDLDDEP